MKFIASRAKPAKIVLLIAMNDGCTPNEIRDGLIKTAQCEDQLKNGIFAEGTLNRYHQPIEIDPKKRKLSIILILQT